MNIKDYELLGFLAYEQNANITIIVYVGRKNFRIRNKTLSVQISMAKYKMAMVIIKEWNSKKIFFLI